MSVQSTGTKQMLPFDSEERVRARMRWKQAIEYALTETRKNRSKRSTIIQNLKSLQHASRFLGMLVLKLQGRPQDEARRRWKKAIWYAIQEARRRREIAGLDEQQAKRRESASHIFQKTSRLMKRKSSIDLVTDATTHDVEAAHHDELNFVMKKPLVQRVHNLLGLRFLVPAAAVFVIYVRDLYIIYTERTPVAHEIAIYSVNAICFFIFAIDWVLKILWDRTYVWSTYMWLEGIATIVMIPDLVVLAFLIERQNSNQHPFATEEPSAVASFLLLLRLVGLGSRAGTQASKALRILQFVKTLHEATNFKDLLQLRKNRIEPSSQSAKDMFNTSPVQPPDIQLVKSHSFSSIATSDVENAREKPRASFDLRTSNADIRGGLKIEDLLRSNNTIAGKGSIANILEKQVSAHFIVVTSLFLGLGIGLTMLLDSSHQGAANAQSSFVSIAFEHCASSKCSEQSLASFLGQMKAAGNEVLFMKVAGHTIFGDEASRQQYRDFPYAEVIVGASTNPDLPGGGGGGGQESVIHMSNRDHVVNMCRSHLILSTVLAGAVVWMTASLSSIIRLEVVMPLQSMGAKVYAIGQKPLSTLSRQWREESAAQGERSREIVLIENGIIKIASLLQLGFGDAGGKIIQQNMRTRDNGLVNSEIPGKIVQAIFGFCDIRNFTDCTEVLQEDVVNLVNRVAQLVHGAVVDNLGAPNKNIGDAFLVVWKPQGSQTISEVADGALRSYIRTIIEVAHCRRLAKFAKRDELQKRLPGFRVKMGFGMHFGWAIEGAIGSAHKIDASYLSPHVNMASRLEAATKQFGVAVLLSEDVYSLLSSHVRSLCRMVDRVKLKGSDRPMMLYTYDVPVLPEGEPAALGRRERLAEAGLEEFFGEVAPPATEASFRTMWSLAVALYLGGRGGEGADWPAARRMIQGLVSSHQGYEGPQRALLEAMDALQGPGGAAPAGWPGYRNLVEK